MRIDRHFLFWLAATAAVILIIGLLREILLPFIAGLVIAYFLNPIADWMERRGVNRMFATGLIIGFAGLLLALALIFLGPLIAEQVRQLPVTLPAQWAKLQVAIDSWAQTRLGPHYPAFQQAMQRAIEEASKSWGTAAGVVFKSLWSQTAALFNFLSLLLITPLVAFYLLADWHRMLAAVRRWVPRDHEVTVLRLAAEVNDAVSAFIRGQGTVCLILALFYSVGLTWVGLNNGLLIGIATGILSFVPFVGFALGLIVATGVALVQFWPLWTPVLKVLAVFAAGIALDSAVLSPKIVGEKIGLHPVWLIFSLFVFSYLFGFVGVLVAVPVAAAIGVIVRYGLEVYLASSMYQGRHAGPARAAAPVLADKPKG